MDRCSSCVAWILAVLCMNIACARAAVSDDPEITSNSVNITFYELSTSEWNAREATFKDTIVDIMGDFCEDNSAICGLTGWADGFEFTSDGVQILSAVQYRFEFNVTLAVLFNGNIPSDNKTDTDSAVPKAAVQAALTEYREDINDAMGHTLLIIEFEKFHPAPAFLLNIILSTIGGAILIFLIILTLALYKWRSRKMKNAQHMHEKEGSGGSARPPHRISPHPHSPVPGTTDIESGQPDYRRHNSKDDSYHGNQTEESMISMEGGQVQGQTSESKPKQHSKGDSSSKYMEFPSGDYGKPYDAPQTEMTVATVSPTGARGSTSDGNMELGVNPSGVTTNL